MIALRLTWAIATFVVYQLVMIPLWLLGWVAVPLAIKFGQWERSAMNGALIYNAPAWLWLWGNDEDGLDPVWYRVANPTWSPFKRQLIWAAWRNSVNNVRCIKWLHPAPVAERIRFVRWGDSWLCWQGVLYYPEDVKGVDPTDWRCWGTGFRWSILRSKNGSA